MRSLVAIWLGALVAVGATAGARACSIDGCSYTYAAPASGVVPANAPALVYSPPPGTDGTPEANLLLLGGDGAALPFTSEPDPATPGAYLVRPAAPLVEGATYRLVSVGRCVSGGNDNGPSRGFDYAFTVGPPSDLPSSLGAVTAQPSSTIEIDVPNDGSCTGRQTVGQTGLVVDSPELAAFRQIARLTLVVDGAPWAREPYGFPGLGDPLARAALSATAPYATCPRSADVVASAPSRLGLGTHHGQLSVHVAGAPTDPPPVEFDFELTCQATPATATKPSGCAVGGAPDGNILGLPLLLLLATIARARPMRRRVLTWGRSWPS